MFLTPAYDKTVREATREACLGFSADQSKPHRRDDVFVSARTGEIHICNTHCLRVEQRNGQFFCAFTGSYLTPLLQHSGSESGDQDHVRGSGAKLAQGKRSSYFSSATDLRTNRPSPLLAAAAKIAELAEFKWTVDHKDPRATHDLLRKLTDDMDPTAPPETEEHRARQRRILAVIATSQLPRHDAVANSRLREGRWTTSELPDAISLALATDDPTHVTYWLTQLEHTPLDWLGDKTCTLAKYRIY